MHFPALLSDNSNNSARSKIHAFESIPGMPSAIQSTTNTNAAGTSTTHLGTNRIAQTAQQMDVLCNEEFSVLIRNSANRIATGRRLASLSAYHSINQLLPIIQWASEGWPAEHKMELVREISKDMQLETKFYLWRMLETHIQMMPLVSCTRQAQTNGDELERKMF